MNKPEPDSCSQKLNYHRELPAQFTSWDQFYDELTRRGLISSDIVRIKVFLPTTSVKIGGSLSAYLTYERHYIERMCLDELRKERSTQSGMPLTIPELERVIQIVSNQAFKLDDWELLLKLKERLRYKQQKLGNQSDVRIESGQ